MIFVTVGTQLPFDRLVKAMDAWAQNNLAEAVQAQIGESAFVPHVMTWEKYLTPSVFREHCAKADLIVSHAGIGNILLAMELQKPILVMPRRADLGEHRNDHQLATVKRLQEKTGIHVVNDAAKISEAIRRCMADQMRPSFPAEASGELLATIREFIADA